MFDLVVIEVMTPSGHLSNNNEVEIHSKDVRICKNSDSVTITRAYWAKSYAILSFTYLFF